MSGDLISREDVLRVFYNKEPIMQGEHDGMGMLAHALWRHIREAVEVIPTVEAEPVVHAHWQLLTSDQKHFFTQYTHGCSKCGEFGMRHYKRCPGCGAVMDEVVHKPTPLFRLSLSNRVRKRLRQIGVVTAEQLDALDKQTLHNIPGLGKKSILEIESELRIWNESKERKR